MSAQEPIIVGDGRDTDPKASSNPRQTLRPEAEFEAQERPGSRNGPAAQPQQPIAEAQEQWQRIQAQFVDDPRKSVAEAQRLVGELMQRLTDAFARERADFEAQSSRAGDVPTEELRVRLRCYREFFARLSPLSTGADMH
jgi:hypothetical protein